MKKEDEEEKKMSWEPGDVNMLLWENLVVGQGFCIISIDKRVWTVQSVSHGWKSAREVAIYISEKKEKKMHYIMYMKDNLLPYG